MDEALTLGRIIWFLKRCERDFVAPLGLGIPESYRGYYHCLSFIPTRNITVEDMLKNAEEAIGGIFYGYKGGEYEMDLNTPCFFAHHGATGDPITKSLLMYMGNAFSFDAMIALG